MGTSKKWKEEKTVPGWTRSVIVILIRTLPRFELSSTVSPSLRLSWVQSVLLISSRAHYLNSVAYFKTVFSFYCNLSFDIININNFTYKGRRHKFTEGAILGALQALKVYRYDGLIRTNELIYDLLCLGKSFEQTIDNDTKSFTLNFIDWKNPAGMDLTLSSTPNRVKPPWPIIRQ